MDYIISYNTYRKYSRRNNIRNETISGKPVTYNKLKHRVNDHLNKKKHKELAPIKNIVNSYLNDDIGHDEFIYNFINNK